MKKISLLGLILVGGFFFFTSCKTSGGGKANSNLTSSQDSISYAIGNYLAQNMKMQGIDIDADLMTKGFNDYGTAKALSEQEAERLINQFQMEMMMRSRDPQAKDKAFEFKIDSVSMAIGQDFRDQMDKMDMDINGDLFGAGAKDFIADQSLLDSINIKNQVDAFSAKMQAKTMEKMQIEGEQNMAEGKTFLAENANKKGIKTTDSGLQYEVLKAGSGKRPSASDKVEVHYEGKLLDDTVFDSSIQRGQTATFGLNQVIPGWTEGLQLMKEGAKYRFYIPGNLAYGERGSPPNIGPNEVLVFDVELIDIK